MTKVAPLDPEDSENEFSLARGQKPEGFDLYSVGKLLESELGDAVRAKLEPQVIEYFKSVFQVYDFVDHRESCTGLFD